MFGMSFGNSAPHQSREKEALNSEVVEVLTEYDFITSPASLSREDSDAIASRVAMLLSSHINRDAAIALAYVDRKVNQEKSSGNSPDAVISKVTPELVSTLVSPELAPNAEFIKTVLNTAKVNFAGGTYAAFSDALIAAVGVREAALISVPTVEGKIDGQDNVVQASDETILH